MVDFSFIEDADIREKAENAHKLEVDELTVDLTNQAKTQVEDAVTGLKNKNAELLDEKKKAQDSLKVFDGIDPEIARTAITFHEENKDAEFLKDGTVDELIDKKTSQLRSDHESALTELSGKLDSAINHGAKYQNLFESKVIDDGLREEAVGQGILPGAVSDIILRGRSVFSLDENGQIEARDAEGKLAVTEDKKVLTPKNWIEGLREKSPHYWPASEGAGAMGGTGAADSDLTKRLNDLAAKGDMKGYRALRDKHAKKK